MRIGTTRNRHILTPNKQAQKREYTSSVSESVVESFSGCGEGEGVYFRDRKLPVPLTTLLGVCTDSSSE